MKKIVWIFLLLAIAVPGWAKAKITKKTFEFQGRVRTYTLYVPEVAEPMPVLLILHGFMISDQYGDPGQPRIAYSMVNSWKDLASSEHFIVVAPNDAGSRPSDFWDGDWNPPEFFRLLMEQIDNQHAIDASRIYLFGDGEGAQYALSIALTDSRFYAAVAIHAGSLNPDYSALLAPAHRRLPIGLWAGNMDQECPLYRVRKSKDILDAAGYPVEMNIVPNHGHDYFTLDGILNERVWKFLKKAQLQLAGPAVVDRQ
ncbi:MAG: hypothetical protein WCF54_05290 [Terracidiphilus sp.]